MSKQRERTDGLIAVFKPGQLLQFQGGEKLHYRDVDGLGGRRQNGEVLPGESNSHPLKHFRAVRRHFLVFLDPIQFRVIKRKPPAYRGRAVAIAHSIWGE